MKKKFIEPTLHEITVPPPGLSGDYKEKPTLTALEEAREQFVLAVAEIAEPDSWEEQRLVERLGKPDLRAKYDAMRDADAKEDWVALHYAESAFHETLADTARADFPAFLTAVEALALPTFDLLCKHYSFKLAQYTDATPEERRRIYPRFVEEIKATEKGLATWGNKQLAAWPEVQEDFKRDLGKLEDLREMLRQALQQGTV